VKLFASLRKRPISRNLFLHLSALLDRQPSVAALSPSLPLGNFQCGVFFLGLPFLILFSLPGPSRSGAAAFFFLLELSKYFSSDRFFPNCSLCFRSALTGGLRGVLSWRNSCFLPPAQDVFGLWSLSGFSGVFVWGQTKSFSQCQPPVLWVFSSFRPRWFPLATPGFFFGIELPAMPKLTDCEVYTQYPSLPLLSSKCVKVFSYPDWSWELGQEFTTF